MKKFGWLIFCIFGFLFSMICFCILVAMKIIEKPIDSVCYSKIRRVDKKGMENPNFL